MPDAFQLAAIEHVIFMEPHKKPILLAPHSLEKLDVHLPYLMAAARMLDYQWNGPRENGLYMASLLSL